MTEAMAAEAGRQRQQMLEWAIQHFRSDGAMACLGYARAFYDFVAAEPGAARKPVGETAAEFLVGAPGPVLLLPVAPQAETASEAAIDEPTAPAEAAPPPVSAPAPGSKASRPAAAPAHEAMPSFGRALPKVTPAAPAVLPPPEPPIAAASPAPPPARVADRVLVALRAVQQPDGTVDRAALEDLMAQFDIGTWQDFRNHLKILANDGLIEFVALRGAKLERIKVTAPIGSPLPAGGRAVRGAQGGKKPIAKGDTIACLNCRHRFVTSGAGQRLCKTCGGRRDDGRAS